MPTCSPISFLRKKSRNKFRRRCWWKEMFRTWINHKLTLTGITLIGKNHRRWITFRFKTWHWSKKRRETLRSWTWTNEASACLCFPREITAQKIHVQRCHDWKWSYALAQSKLSHSGSHRCGHAWIFFCNDQRLKHRSSWKSRLSSNHKFYSKIILKEEILTAKSSSALNDSLEAWQQEPGTSPTTQKATSSTQKFTDFEAKSCYSSHNQEGK